MNGPYRALSVAGIVSLSAVFAPAASAEPRAVVELFTSQGCSSCPPADQVIGQMATDNSLVAMTLAVDYWDYLGWKDTLARPRHALRQRGYAAKRGDREIYTPQAVINGMTHVVGSDRAAIDKAIEETNRTHPALVVPVHIANDGDSLKVSISSVNEEGPAGEIWLVALSKMIPVAITRGENRGRTVDYHNVVRRWVKLGTWKGAGQSFTVAKNDFAADNADSVAVLVQAGTADSPSIMLGAATAPLR
jgi:hypothetical protein